jgi:NADH-quinone oxidoreductase subunit A
MLSDYLGVLALIVVAAAIAVVFVGGSWLLGPKKRTPYKQAPYECGVTPVGDAKERFPIKFYLVGILFIIFDVEVVFLWSWMTVYKGSSLAFKQFTLVEFLTYMLSWVVGYIYVIRVGAIDWDEATSLHPAKLGTTESPREAA